LQNNVAVLQPNLLINLSKTQLPGPSNVSSGAKNKRLQKIEEIAQVTNKKAKTSAVGDTGAEKGPAEEPVVAGACQSQQNTKAARKPKALTKAQQMSRANTIFPARKVKRSFR
jgi:hypothetical protein